VCIGSSVGGTLKVSAKLKIAGVRKPVTLAQVSTPVRAGRTARLHLPIRARARTAVKKALRANRRVRATVKASVSDATGGRGVIAFQVLGAR
jgi:hypothetical protein